MTNFYTATKEINGRKIVAQFNGIGAAIQAVDNSYIEGTSNTSLKKLAQYIFDNVIVEPKLTFNDFGVDEIGVEQKKTINGVEYVAKFNGLEAALEAIDNSYIDGTNNTSIEKLSTYLLENVITSPKNLTVDSFDSMDDFNKVVGFAREVMQGGKAMSDFNDVIAFAREVMQGNFRDKQNAKSTKTTSKG